MASEERRTAKFVAQLQFSVQARKSEDVIGSIHDNEDVLWIFNKRLKKYNNRLVFSHVQYVLQLSVHLCTTRISENAVIFGFLKCSD